ncbi:GNAT family N-acetyltransferase [Bradyrhizobium liaoningense]|uniref:GNAT family N-acetyltransferase n=1 Tax=Bradyrhizobium liaoningense TaxID=43992 RepID=UPI001BA6E68F|nr:GNAT family protein [Bradyrhizobium liaoningense]MBR0838806.1 GNAT family N-acetyltransferase [Bradyrhizobium liaoningense]
MQTKLPTLVGDKAAIRSVRAEDVEGFLALESDPAIHEMFGGSRDTYRPITRSVAEGIVKRLADHPFAWVIEHASHAIGEVRLDRVDMQDRRASFAVGILDPNYLGRGIGTEAMRLALQFAFEQMSLHRISVRVLAYNHRAIRAYQKCGFLVEGRERESAWVNDHWHDDLIMGLLDREFR